MCLLLFLVVVSVGVVAETPYKDPVQGEFGLRDHHNLCLLLKFQARLYNFNLNGSDIAMEMADFSSEDTRLSGFCALHNEVRKTSQLVSDWLVGERRKQLKFTFKEAFVRGVGQPVDELRWQLSQVVYTEHFKGRIIEFSSSNGSALLSAPVRQRLLCKDKLNITLHNPKYKDMVLELLPEIDMQPVNTGAGFGSNIYVCERTRKRTLGESFQSRVTIFSGVVLGLSSVGTMAGYSIWRQMLPVRKDVYNNI